MLKSVAALITKFKYKEIKQLFRKARYCYQSQQLDIKISPLTGEIAKLLIVIPKKVGNAPTRNLIRRRLKSIFFENQMYKNFYNLIVFCKPGIQNLEFEQLKDIVLNSLKVS